MEIHHIHSRSKSPSGRREWQNATIARHGLSFLGELRISSGHHCVSVLPSGGHSILTFNSGFRIFNLCFLTHPKASSYHLIINNLRTEGGENYED